MQIGGFNSDEYCGGIRTFIEKGISAVPEHREGISGEVRSLLRVAFEIGYFDEPTYKTLSLSVTVLSKSLAKQIAAIKGTL